MGGLLKIDNKLFSIFNFSVKNSISFNSLTIEEGDLSVSVYTGEAPAIAVAVSVSVFVSVEEAFSVAVTATGEVVVSEFGNKELGFEDVFIEFVNKEGEEVLLLKEFNLLLFEDINGI
jgi:hypothetical protein